MDPTPVGYVPGHVPTSNLEEEDKYDRRYIGMRRTEGQRHCGEKYNERPGQCVGGDLYGTARV